MGECEAGVISAEVLYLCSGVGFHAAVLFGIRFAKGNITCEKRLYCRDGSDTSESNRVCRDDHER